VTEPRFSDFGTVREVVALIRFSGSGPGGPHTRWTSEANATLPRSKPYARMFLAWELYYKNPNAREDAKKAICGL